MTNQHRATATGFHRGELAVQRQAGVQTQAARLVSMVAGGELRAGTGSFLAKATFAAIAARDGAGRLWTSPLFGPPGFLRVESTTRLLIDTTPRVSDPLRDLPAGQPAGLVVIDFATRRRVRINGILAATSGGLAVDVEQAYGNCPQYIHPRHLSVSAPSGAEDGPETLRGDRLQPQDIAFVHAADTFFLGTTHPESGNDASHRGGPAGFVHAAPDHLWWPDYPGNNMFNSFGNLAIDPTAALLFVDFRSGATLQLSGTATVRWDAGPVGEDTPTGRRVVF
ncbi:pyridoxamine 5'-phosphate oxidase, partial [Mycobacterium intermedium]